MRGVTVSKVHPRRSRWGILRRGGPLDPPHGTWITFATEEEAQRERAKALRELARAQGGAQISAAVEEYLALLARRGRKASSIAACRGMLAAFWPEQSELIASVGPADYEALVKRDSPRGKPYSVAFHQQALIRARAVCALAVKRGRLKSNPLVDVGCWSKWTTHTGKADHSAGSVSCIMSPDGTEGRSDRGRRLQRLVHAAEVVPGDVQRHRRGMVAGALAEAVGQAREPSHAHAAGQVLPLDVARRDVRPVRLAGDDLALWASAPPSAARA